jgi:hypothetical protein
VISGAVCNTAARITEKIGSVLLLFAAFAGKCARLSTTGGDVKASWQYGSSILRGWEHVTTHPDLRASSHGRIVAENAEMNSGL